MATPESKRHEVGILGRKLGMTQVFAEDGSVVPVTVVEAGPCPVIQVKTKASDGYDAIQIGFADIREKLVNKARKGHFKKASQPHKRYLRELRQTAESIAAFTVGHEVKVDIFKTGDVVDVVGKSIGKGFQGVMKRWNHKGKDSGHGTHEVFRHGGSLGMRFPQRVAKGKHMAGHMGAARVTTMNLSIFDVKPESNLLLVRGAIPGHRGSLVLVRKGLKH